MTTKEAIAGIRKLLFGEDTPPVPAAPVATEYTLGDGSTVCIDKLEVGGKVSAKDGTAVADGDITLADGTVLTVAAGIITEVKAPTPVEEPLDTPEKMRAALQKFADGAAPDQQGLVLIVRALFENVFGWEIRQQKEKVLRDQAIATYQAGFASQKDGLKQLVELVEAISAEEIEKPLETDKKEWDKMSPLEKFRAQKEMFKKAE